MRVHEVVVLGAWASDRIGTVTVSLGATWRVTNHTLQRDAPGTPRWMSVKLARH